MVRYLRSDATNLSDKDIQDIINAKNTMKRASEAMAAKYKISSRRVYQIWRGVDPPIDTSIPCNISDYSHKLSIESQHSSSKISNQELDEFYKKESERCKKNIERSLSIMKKEPILEEVLHHE